MNPAYEPLFTPFSIRSTRIKNRYFMAAMGTIALLRYRQTID